MDKRMNISEEGLKYVAELFNGDVESVFTYKSGPKIFAFFNKYFSFNDSYQFGVSYPSRWTLTYDKLVELWNGSKFDSFLSRILSISYLKTEKPDLAVNELSDLSNKILNLLNEHFRTDGIKVVKYADCYKLAIINDDEVLLGEGGYACCYYIKSKSLVEKRLKEENYIDSGVVHRFRREYEITKSLGDLDGIVKVFDFNDKELSYTMELGECDLYSYVINGSLDDDIKRRVIYQIVYILNEVHKRDVIHRDLGPKNIFIISGQLKIADFGLGKDLNAFYSHQTMKTNSVGQYYYCDPRQFMRLKDGDKQSDIYSIGKIINFVYTSDPNSKSHKYYSVVEKATCDEKFRYKSIEDLIQGLKNVDEIELDKEFENNFLKKVEQGKNLDETDIDFICSFNANKMFEMTHSANFRFAFVKAAEQEMIDENMFLEKLDILYGFYQSNRVSWDDYDQIGFLGTTILLSNCSYIAKERAIDFINVPISATRYRFMDMVRREILGNIDPTLEEKIDNSIKN